MCFLLSVSEKMASEQQTMPTFKVSKQFFVCWGFFFSFLFILILPASDRLTQELWKVTNYIVLDIIVNMLLFNTMFLGNHMLAC